MIEGLIFLVLFALLVPLGATYRILFLAALVNVIVYPFTSDVAVIIEAMVDSSFLMFLILYGDRHVKYQCALLFIVLFNHLVFELYPNYIYGDLITLITILQLGGVYGFLERVWTHNHDNNVYSHSSSYLHKEKT